MERKNIGEVVHFYNHLGVALVRLREKLRKGDKVHFLGHSTDFDQTVESLELDHDPSDEANPGDIVGIKVSKQVRERDQVIKE